MSIQQDRNSMVCCCTACTLGIKHIEVSICASDDAASNDREMSFSMQEDGATMMEQQRWSNKDGATKMEQQLLQIV